ncbi:phosphoribosylanthranilate isomerase [Brevibacillus humidisoli]|uniref:phosphoribosylanthranilate isomerase n=1 Tax=Brevibacillus humidisoli TaxID=2895522 RepID=UPI001E48383A|nr:phosphoribosylanthranilate isomerase [Brevibacillus humidisoli]UFJ42772.1 phosphoribosylanthranilate isomerase [Brevibacillus humidisoli]
MTCVKICGVRDAETLRLLSEQNVDYVGFVFAESRRRVSPQQVGEMLRQVPDHPPAVGVFVNPTREELDNVFEHALLQVIQLHGRESPDDCVRVRDRYHTAVWKAISVKDGEQLAAEVDRYRSCVDAFLFDTYDKVLAGGTGRRFSWERIPELAELAGSVPFFVAGGIDSVNVGRLLDAYGPQAIDISSGVETDGVKDHNKIQTFLERVREHDQDDGSQSDGA